MTTPERRASRGLHGQRLPLPRGAGDAGHPAVGAADRGDQRRDAGHGGRAGGRARGRAAVRGERGSLRDFRSRQLDEQLVSAADLVLTMTREHRAAVVSLVPTALRRTFTLTEFAELLPAARPGATTHRSRLAAQSFPFDVPDPYGRSRRRYRAALEMIRAATDGVVVRGRRHCRPHPGVDGHRRPGAAGRPSRMAARSPRPGGVITSWTWRRPPAPGRDRGQLRLLGLLERNLSALTEHTPSAQVVVVDIFTTAAEQARITELVPAWAGPLSL